MVPDSGIQWSRHARSVNVYVRLMERIQLQCSVGDAAVVRINPAVGTNCSYGFVSDVNFSVLLSISQLFHVASLFHRLSSQISYRSLPCPCSICCAGPHILHLTLCCSQVRPLPVLLLWQGVRSVWIRLPAHLRLQTRCCCGRLEFRSAVPESLLERCSWRQQLLSQV